MREFTLVRSQRKTIALQLNADGTLVVRAPSRMKLTDIQAFVASREGWIEKHLAKRPQTSSQLLTVQELEELGHAAAEDLSERTARFAKQMGLRYGRITIRTQKSRWGSCSGRGNLNYNRLLMLAPEPVRDYVVVHELCHLRQMNHSPQFWALVEENLPDYREPKKWLKDHGRQLMARLPE